MDLQKLRDMMADCECGHKHGQEDGFPERERLSVRAVAGIGAGTLIGRLAGALVFCVLFVLFVVQGKIAVYHVLPPKKLLSTL